jgi:hypothetical protein
MAIKKKVHSASERETVIQSKSGETKRASPPNRSASFPVVLPVKFSQSGILKAKKKGKSSPNFLLHLSILTTYGESTEVACKNKVQDRYSRQVLI